MATKRKAFVHIGLDDGSGDFVDGALDLHARALLELGVRRPAASGEEMFRAALEVLRAHRDWGYTRSEVEGAWTDIVRRGRPGKETLVFSHPFLCAARPEQVALLVDALVGFEVHVVITAQAPSAWTVPGEPRHDLGAVLGTWSAAVKKPERLHVIIADEPLSAWKAFGRVVGFGTSSLKIDDLLRVSTSRPPRPALASRLEVLRRLGEAWVELLANSEYDVVGDAAALVPTAEIVGEPETVARAAEHALCEAYTEIERLARRNESLQVKIAASDRKRKKFKRRLSPAA